MCSPSTTTTIVDLADMCRDDSFDNVPIFAWMAFWPLILAVVVWYLKGEHDQPIRYRVPSPKVPEPQEILQKPSIKVRVMLLRQIMDIMAHTSLTGLRRQCNSVLCPSHRPIPRFYQPFNSGGHRPSR